MKAINTIKTIGTTPFHTKSFVIGILLCWFLPSNVLANNVVVNGIRYILNTTDRTAAVDGRSTNLVNNGTSALIPASIDYEGITYSVTSIGSAAFFGDEELVAVNIPNSVTSIGSVAFLGCKHLRIFGIPNSVTNIGSGAFKYCEELNRMRIPSSVTSIGGDIFQGCTALTSIIVDENNEVYDSRNNCNAIIETSTNTLISGCNGTVIPDGVTDIGSRAFYNCSSLTSVEIPSSVTSIEEQAFYGCTGLTSVTIGNSVESIGEEVFEGCTSLTSVTIGNSVKTIGNNAFEGCTSLTSVTIGNSVETIGDNAFEGCTSLDFVVIPSSVTWIGYHVFQGCTALTSIIVDENNEVYDSRNNCNAIIETSSNTLIFGSNNTVIPDGVTGIVDFAFENCSTLTSVVIPSSVTTIGNCAFRGCTALNSIIVDENNGVYDSRDNCNAIIEKSNSRLFIGCRGTFIPGGIECIGVEAFAYCPLTRAEIPRTVTTIEDGAFKGCTALTWIDIPSSVSTIGSSAFSDCTGLTSIMIANPLPIDNSTFYNVNKSNCTLYVPFQRITDFERSPGWSEFGDIVERVGLQIQCGNSAWCTLFTDMNMEIYGAGDMYDFETYFEKYSLDTKKLFIKEGITSIGTIAFANFPYLTSLTFPNSLISIDPGAFNKCTGLTSVTIGNNVTTIGDFAFHLCNNLTSVEIPNSVITIGNNAFEECTRLTSVTIGNNVTTIGDFAFHLCNNLTSVEIPNSVITIGNNAFEGCTRLTSVTIGNNVTTIGDCAFYECRGLTSVDIPNSVTSIGDYAFQMCTGLTSVTIPNSVTSIGNYAFADCSGLTSVTIPNSVTSIKDHTFFFCIGLASVNIPNSVTSIGPRAFDGCTGLTSITCENESPIVISSDLFLYVDKSTCTLYVPTGSKTAYENAKYWGEFENIVEYSIEPTSIEALDNAIYVDHIEGRIGGTMDIPIKVKNSAPIDDFKFKMILPAGTTVNSWALSSNRLPSGATVDDYFSEQNIVGNTITLACMLNYNESKFTGNDGEIATVNVTFGENMEVGTYPILLTGCNIGHIDLSDVKATLNLEDYVVGDANGDGRVRIGDASAILHYIVGNPSEDFQEKAADVNGDGLIRIGDVSAVLKIIVGL